MPWSTQTGPSHLTGSYRRLRKTDTRTIRLGKDGSGDAIRSHNFQSLYFIEQKWEKGLAKSLYRISVGKSSQRDMVIGWVAIGTYCRYCFAKGQPFIKLHIWIGKRPCHSPEHDLGNVVPFSRVWDTAVFDMAVLVPIRQIHLGIHLVPTTMNLPCFNIQYPHCHLLLSGTLGSRYPKMGLQYYSANWT